MEEIYENPHERLKQKLSELEQEWTAMKTGKSSSAVSWITVEGALDFVENSPRKLMLSLQHDQPSPEAEMIQLRSPFRRKLFHDSDSDGEDFDGSKETSFAQFTPSSCLSSNVMRVRENKKKKQRGRLVCVVMVVLLLLVLVVLINGFDHLFMDRHIDTLVPT
ncbi:unnamed protein product [Microthlaspi erraticum]|uniref:Uncharacterized protein n=1 Tax=Microthlaspi erraticum TaxID=1685480 RepID=A0A6D2JC51_9BRAS|nr:unnamed protein product [Microthlaspi erraticum]